MVQWPEQSNSSLSEQVAGRRAREDFLRSGVSFSWQQQTLNCSKSIFKKCLNGSLVLFSLKVKKMSDLLDLWQVRRTKSSHSPVEHCIEGTIGGPVKIFK